MNVLVINNGSGANKGSQALNRGIVRILREQCPRRIAFTFYTPTPKYDQTAMSDLSDCRFLAYPALTPFRLRLLTMNALAVRLLGNRRFVDTIRRSDAVISTGGDTLTPDYGDYGLRYHLGLLAAAQRLRKPTMVWAATLGPYPARVRRFAKRVLSRVDCLSVRESETAVYLQRMGLGHRAELVADPAFRLAANGQAALSRRFKKSRFRIGLAASRGIVNYAGLELRGRLAMWSRVIDELIERFDCEVLLVPHVSDAPGSRNDDREICKELYEKSRNRSRLVHPLGDWDAEQLKSLIQTCDLFIAERMHAAIAALSSAVPTVSISYSVKTTGMNRDLFGDTRFVLSAQEVTAETLLSAVEAVHRQAEAIRRTLAERLPAFEERANRAGELFLRLVAAPPYREPRRAARSVLMRETA